MLVYQYRHPLGRRLWELPAGLLDVAGEAPHLTAARELEEEAGLKADAVDRAGRRRLRAGFQRRERADLSRHRADATSAGPVAHDEEADLIVDRYPLADAVQMVFRGEIVNSLAVAGILAAHAVRTGVAQPRPVDAPWPRQADAVRGAASSGQERS